MRRVLCAIAIAAGLFAIRAEAGPPPPADANTASPEDARSLLLIDSGRLVVMMDQTRAALQLLEPRGAHDDAASSAAERAYAFQELVAAVLHYNHLEQQACRAHIAAREHCTGPYLPAWLKDPPDKDHSEAELRTMVEEASKRLVPFWTDLCDKGRAAAHDEHFCDLE